MTAGGDAPPVAAVVTVGDELLLGRTVDSNAAWLSAEMARLGVRVARRYTVGDVREDIGEAIAHAVAQVDVVLVTGGLGPTADDVTRDAVARVLDTPLEAEPLHNPVGVAPGLWIQVSRPAARATAKVPVVLLPGVPAEMEAIVKAEVEPRLRRTFGQRLHPLRHRTLHTTGIPESELAGRVEAAVAPVIEAYRFEADERGDLVEPLSRALEVAGATVATAESCTGGLVAKRLTDRAGSSKIFLGGVIAYADRVKVARLGIDPEVLRREGAVSGAVAEAMASGVAAALDADFGVGVTGIAGPGGGSEAKPVGLVWYAVWTAGSAVKRREVFPGDRAGVRERAAQAALALLFDVVRRTP